MIDIFTLALTHGLMALAVITLLSRADLDSEEPQKPGRPGGPETASSEPPRDA